MIDKKILIAVGAILLIIIAAAIATTYCVGPTILNTRAGNMRFACLFPTPWSYIFGVGPRIYDFNFYICVGLPGILLAIWFLSTFIHRDE